jgi:hypothetical protein
MTPAFHNPYKTKRIFFRQEQTEMSGACRAAIGSAGERSENAKSVKRIGMAEILPPHA